MKTYLVITRDGVIYKVSGNTLEQAVADFGLKQGIKTSCFIETLDGIRGYGLHIYSTNGSNDDFLKQKISRKFEDHQEEIFNFIKTGLIEDEVKYYIWSKYEPNFDLRLVDSYLITVVDLEEVK